EKIPPHSPSLLPTIPAANSAFGSTRQWSAFHKPFCYSRCFRGLGCTQKMDRPGLCWSAFLAFFIGILSLAAFATERAGKAGRNSTACGCHLLIGHLMPDCRRRLQIVKRRDPSI